MVRCWPLGPAAPLAELRVNSRTLAILFAIALVSALVAVAAWHHTSSALHDSRAMLLGSTLEPIATLLKENQALIQELQLERGW
jgi:hypothetical protein